MAKRKRVGLIFRYSEAVNAGLVNYGLSIINALKYLPDEKKPYLVIFHTDSAPLDKIQSLNYPYIEYYPIPHECYQVLPKTDRFSRFVNRLSYKFLKKPLLCRGVPRNYVDCLFPCYGDLPYFKAIDRKIYWIVDFNAYYFPEHYSPESLERFKATDLKITQQAVPLVVSSEAVQADLNRFYPQHQNQVHVLRFTCLPQYLGEEAVNPEVILSKYGVQEPYFISPNQFWPHKNHRVVLEAVRELATQEPELDFQVIFTGKTQVSRGEGYFESLQDFVAQHRLEKYIKFLGLIDRNDQMTLIRKAHAVIQPSLFEGWSTLVEEAKALNKYLIVSDLPIHREQVSKNQNFFDPENCTQLSKLIRSLLEKFPAIKYSNYENNIKQYAHDLQHLFLLD
jgi:glycosyltransferase involved in cell wall biosynthesis